MIARLLARIGVVTSAAVLLAALPAKADSIQVGSLTRNYIQYTVPDPVAIVIVYHGTTGTAQAMANLTGMHLLGAPAIVIYPQGILWTWDVSEGSKDVDFTQALIKKFRAQYGDLPVYVAGLSAGGSMAWRDGQELDVDRVVAVAGDCLDPKHLTSTHKPDLLDIQGDSDTIVPLNGGTRLGVDLPPISQCVAAFNKAGGDAALRVIPGGEHAWDLGVGYDTSRVIMRYFGLR